MADASLPVLVGMGVCVIIVVPVCEEIFFRRLLFGLLRPLGAWAAVAGGAALFSAAHLFLLGAPSLFLMGPAFQLVYLWRRQSGRLDADARFREPLRLRRHAAGSARLSPGVRSGAEICVWTNCGYITVEPEFSRQ